MSVQVNVAGGLTDAYDELVRDGVELDTAAVERLGLPPGTHLSLGS